MGREAKFRGAGIKMGSWLLLDWVVTTYNGEG